jgi:hypothetical protein
VSDYERYWTPFDARFHFRPGMDPATWPAIEEPPGSVTVDLTPVFANDSAGFAKDEDRINDLVLDAFVELFPEDTRLVALNWQHPCYWFWPHRQRGLGETWRIPPFPNGDYFIFLTEDMSQGTFGHPWEQSLCIFGGRLVASLAPRLTGWLPIARSQADGM